MDIRGELRYRSLYWYNDGLRKAKIRDLTGAENSLKKSIQFDKYNKDARNLLGLVYYGRGDVTRALVVWTVSLKLVPADNIASDYIDEIQIFQGGSGSSRSDCEEVQPVPAVLQTGRGRSGCHPAEKDRNRTP